MVIYPVSVYLTMASVNDVKGLDELYIEPAAIYLMDKGYVDFNRLFKLINKKMHTLSPELKITCFSKLYQQALLIKVQES